MGTPSHELGDQQSGRYTPKDLFFCILNEFSSISAGRIHKLAFLIEHKHYVETGERLTSAHYKLELGGCHSLEIGNVINEVQENHEGVRSEWVKIGDEKVHSIIADETIECPIDEDSVTENIKMIVKEYGKASKKKINKELKKIDVYQDTEVGNIMTFLDQ